MKSNIRIDNLDILARRVVRQFGERSHPSVSDVRDHIVANEDTIKHLSESQIVHWVFEKLCDEAVNV